MRRSTCLGNGSRNTGASSIRAGTRFGRRRSPVRRRSASCPPIRCLRRSPRRSRTGLRLATTRKAVRPRDGGVRRLRRICRHRNRPARVGDRRTRPARQHAHLLHHRRQRRERGRRHERPLQRGTYFNGVPEHVETSSSTSTSSAVPTLIPTMPPAGRSQATRPSPGRSRSPRTTAARATAWSFTGRRGSNRRTRSARSGIT